MKQKYSKKYHRAYYLENKEQMNAYTRAYYHKHRFEITKRNFDNYIPHPKLNREEKLYFEICEGFIAQATQPEVVIFLERMKQHLKDTILDKAMIKRRDR